MEDKQERTCRNCRSFAIRFTGTGTIYLCNGIILADEDERFIPRKNCPRWRSKEEKEVKIN